MKILVLNGSPKGEKSDTLHITRAFLDGMNEAEPQEVHTVHVIDRHIEYCTGCFSCFHGSPLGHGVFAGHAQHHAWRLHGAAHGKRFWPV